MNPFSLLIKPTGADCNLRCEYCFYLGKKALYPATTRHRMTEATLEAMIRGYMATSQPVYAFGWQGGEPTLMGLDFFRKATDLQQRYGANGVAVSNGVQTNATLIDDALAEHWAQYRFLAGCSLDGPAELHDRYRRTAGGGPSHAAVLRGIETLRRRGVEFNILVLVSRANVEHAARVYRYLTEQGFYYQQYIPCVEFDAAGRLRPFAIEAREWGRFNIELFEAWQGAGDTRRVSIRHFDAALRILLDGTATLCSMGRDCRQYFVVEHTGDIYPCDFFVESGLKLGNVADTDWAAAQNAPLYRTFGARKAQWHARCRTCPQLDLCAGDCPKHRLHGGAGKWDSLSWLCEGWRMFYKRARPAFSALAAEVRERERLAARPEANRAEGPGGATGRNALCPCGSGRKFKKCCGA